MKQQVHSDILIKAGAFIPIKLLQRITISPLLPSQDLVSDLPLFPQQYCLVLSACPPGNLHPVDFYCVEGK